MGMKYLLIWNREFLIQPICKYDNLHLIISISYKKREADTMLLTNLTRWRTLPWDWRSALAEVKLSFQEDIVNVQDLFSIILSEVWVLGGVLLSDHTSEYDTYIKSTAWNPQGFSFFNTPRNLCKS